MKASAFWHGSSISLPQSGSIVSRFSADTISASDNQTITSWTDAVGGIVAGTTVGTGPVYKTGRLNGKPSVTFSGGGLSIASPGALKTAIDSLDYTVFIVFRTLGSSSFGALLAASAGGGSLLYYSDGTNVGRFGGPNAAPYTASGFSTLGSSCFNTVPSYSSSGKFEIAFVNGGAVQGSVNGGAGTAGNTICIGTNAGNNFPVSAEIFEIIVWSVPLTPPQYMQAQMWACNKYGQAYPWSSLTAFNTFFGDSITCGVGASDLQHSAPYLAAQTLGLTYGQWHNFSVGGIPTYDMTLLAPTWVDPIPALIGLKHNVVGFEWYNENLFVPGSTATQYSDATTYLAARKAISNQRTVWGTSTSLAADPNANRATYDSNFDSSHPNVDSYMAIHNDIHIGVNGSYSTYSSTGDGVHLTDTTYPYLASLFVSGIQALP